MLWEARPLRELVEADIREVVQCGLAEHLQLEYKSALYDGNNQGRREFLLDVCMFANAAGGILLIGIPERRDENHQPTGTPDADGVLGLDLPNPEAVLNSYDARVMEAVEERLSLESAAINVGDGRQVLVMRVPNSARKPHSVRHEGHVYFPSRRERQRYHLSVREIKELVMRTAGKLEQAKEVLRASFRGVARQPRLPYLVIGMVPVFFEDFMVDVRARNVRDSMVNFNLAEGHQYRDPVYTFSGLERREGQRDCVIRFQRNGLLNASLQLPLIPQGQGDAPGPHVFFLTAVDALLFRFLPQARAVYEAARVGAPYILSMMLLAQEPVAGAFETDLPPPAYGVTASVRAGDYLFPDMQIDDLTDAVNTIRPLCDQLHQTFGRESSPSFNEAGAWVARYPAPR